MKRLIIKEIVKMSAKCIVLTLVVVGIIVAIGYTRKWDTPVKYSDAFFMAGGFLIIAGGFSRYTSGSDFNFFQQISAESFRGMSSSEQAIFIINASSSVSTAVLGVLTGIFLIIISAITANLL
jgi:hypothetical protein